MTFNRNKSLTKAQKLLQKGKINEAIAELQTVVDNDPSDVRTLLRIGDLYAKIGNIEAACDTYHQVGERYAKDGFFLKAVAVFKQILKLDPALIRVYVRLAELYQQLGLNSEAMKQYQVVVRHYESQGLKKESLDILRKMSDLDPENTASRVKLAELYVREGHAETASDQFKGITSDLAKKGNTQDLVRVYEKMEGLGLLTEPMKIELCEIYIKVGEPKKALTKLQDLFREKPKSPAVLELLARTFIDLQQPEKSKSVYSELVRVFEEQGAPLERDRIMAKLRTLGVSSIATASPRPAEEAPAGEDESFDAPTVEMRAVELSPETAPGRVTPPAPPGEASGATPTKALQEVEIFLNYGLVEKACQILAPAVVADPGNQELRAKLKACYLEKGDPAGLLEVLNRAAVTAERLGRSAVASAIRAEIGSLGPAVVPDTMERIPAVESHTTEIISEEDLELAELELDGSVNVEIVDDQIEELKAAAPSEPAGKAEAPEMVVLPLAAPLEELASAKPEAGVEVSPEGEFERPELPPDQNLELSELRFEEESVPIEEAADIFSEKLLDEIPAETPPAEAEQPSLEAAPGAASQEVSFSTMERASGAQMPEEELVLEDEIPSTPAPEKKILEPLAEPAPSKIGPKEPREPVQAKAASEPVFVGEPASEIPLIVEEEPAIEEPGPAPKPAIPVFFPKPPVVAEEESTWSVEMEEAQFFVSQGLLDEAQEVYETILETDPSFTPAKEKLAELKALRPSKATVRPDGEGPERREAPRKPKVQIPTEEPRPASKSTERVLREQKQAEGEPYFDLGSELQDEIHELEEDLARKKTDDEEEYLSPEEVISEFKKGVQRTVSKTDYQTHYNLGIAYKEMGLLNEAISEFELASSSPKMTIDCASMIGLCLIGKRDYEAAIDVYRKALARTSPQSAEALGLAYELAEAYLGFGKLHDAYKLFARIRDVDPGFRDVRRRARELEADLGASAPHPSSPEKKEAEENSKVKISNKKNKISYI
ncbi:MAG: tetratricopeptide repeat protein [Pseudomonadota bacterium]